MSSPTPVTIVRPVVTRGEMIADAITHWLYFFARGAAVMYLARQVFGLDWSYWDSLVVWMVVSFLIDTTQPSCEAWTARPRKPTAAKQWHGDRVVTPKS